MLLSFIKINRFVRLYLRKLYGLILVKLTYFSSSDTQLTKNDTLFEISTQIKRGFLLNKFAARQISGSTCHFQAIFGIGCTKKPKYPDSSTKIKPPTVNVKSFSPM